MILYGVWTIWQRRSGSFDELRDHPRFYQTVVTFSGLIWLLTGIAFVAGSRVYKSIGEGIVGYAALFATVIFLLLFGLSLAVDMLRRLRALISGESGEEATDTTPSGPAARQIVNHPVHGMGLVLSPHVQDGQDYLIVQFGTEVLTVPADSVVTRSQDHQTTAPTGPADMGQWTAHEAEQEEPHE